MRKILSLMLCLVCVFSAFSWVGCSDPCAEGHTEGTEWVVDAAPTCTESGKRHLNCTVCGEVTRYDYPAATGKHNVQNGLCVDCGESAYQILATYVVENGEYDSEVGTYEVMVVYDNEIIGIATNSSKSELSFSLLYVYEDGDMDFVTIDLYSNQTYQDVGYCYTLSSGTTYYAIGEIYRNTFSSDYDYAYIYSFYTPTSSVSSSLKSLMTTATVYALKEVRDVIADANIGITLNDLGFANY